MTFENKLLNGIPFAEAAQYFTRLRGFDKQASFEDLEKAIAALPPEEREALLKEGNMGAPSLPATAKGMNMPAVQPAALPPTAMGQNKVGSDKSPEDVGKERAHASLSAEFEKEKHHRSEGHGGMVGKLLGGAAGAVALHHYGKGNPVATLGGAALGEHLGGQLGRHAGATHDRHSYEKKHAEAFKRALSDLGMAPVAPPIEPQLDPATQAMIAAEGEAQAAQDVNEAAFLREKVQEMKAQQEASEAKATMLEQKEQMAQQALTDAQAQIQESIQNATQAQDMSLQQQQAAAAMRMAYQQLRGQVLQIASQDPPALGTNEAALAAASTAAGPSSAPAPQSGPAGQSPNPGTPNTVAPEGDDQISRPVQPNEPMFGNAEPTSQAGQKEPQGDAKIPGKESLASAKVASLADYFRKNMGAFRGALPNISVPGAAVGAALGAAGGLAESRMSNDPLRQHVQQLEANPDRGVRDTMDLAQARGRLTIGEFAEKHPGISAGMGALGGAVLGGTQGPGVVDAMREAGGHIKNIGKNVSTMMKGAA